MNTKDKKTTENVKRSLVYILSEVQWEYNDSTYDSSGEAALLVYRTESEAIAASQKKTYDYLLSRNREIEYYEFNQEYLQCEQIANKYGKTQEYILQNYSKYFALLDYNTQMNIVQDLASEFYTVETCEIVGGKYTLGFDEAGT